MKIILSSELNASNSDTEQSLVQFGETFITV